MRRYTEVQYENAFLNPSAATRVFGFRAYDGNSWSTEAKRTMAFTAVNQVAKVTLTKMLWNYAENDPPAVVGMRRRRCSKLNPGLIKQHQGFIKTLIVTK